LLNVRQDSSKASCGGQAILENDENKQEEQSNVARVSRGELFLIFLKAGLAFGGGLGILAVLEDELVAKRRVVSREEFLTIYGIGRIVPSGTMTALAVAYGYKFAGMPGTLIALAALALPVFVLTIALTIAYHYLRDSRVFDLLPVTIMPAALALIVVAALKLGKDVFRPSREFVIAGVAFAVALFLHLNPALLLLAGGVIGAFVLKASDEGKERDKKEEKGVGT
jgi:chromate transporter